jgi:hypothetical protein
MGTDDYCTLPSIEIEAKIHRGKFDGNLCSHFSAANKSHLQLLNVPPSEREEAESRRRRRKRGKNME